MWGPYNVEVVDTLALPADLPEGEWAYVLNTSERRNIHKNTYSRPELLNSLIRPLALIQYSCMNAVFRLPGDLSANSWICIQHVGEWVLGWRWDCEESNQVWASCSDVTIVSPARAAS